MSLGRKRLLDTDDASESSLPKKKRKMELLQTSTSSRFVELAKESKRDWLDKKDSEYVGVNVGNLRALRSFSNAVISDLESHNRLPHELPHHAEIARMLMFVKQRRIEEISQPLHRAIYDSTVRHYFDQSGTSNGTYTRKLLDTLTSRWKVRFFQQSVL